MDDSTQSWYQQIQASDDVLTLDQILQAKNGGGKTQQITARFTNLFTWSSKGNQDDDLKSKQDDDEGMNKIKLDDSFLFNLLIKEYNNYDYHSRVKELLGNQQKLYNDVNNVIDTMNQIKKQQNINNNKISQNCHLIGNLIKEFDLDQGMETLDFCMLLIHRVQNQLPKEYQVNIDIYI
jgi:hypothetical protein